MTTFTVRAIDYAQRTQLLAYMKKNKFDFEISEPEEKQPSETFIKSMEELKTGVTYRLQNTENPIAEILQ